MDNKEAIGLACRMFKLHSACKSIARIGAESLRVGKKQLKIKGFNTLRTLYVLTIDRPQGITGKQLAAAMSVSQTVISITLEKLVKQGLVKRRENPADRRSILLTLTPKAHEQVEAAAVRQGLAIAEILAAMPEEQTQALQSFAESTEAYFKQAQP